ncbi:MAG: DNA alkylation repair protein [Candidatus Omnitrophota bacterium]
MKLQDIRASLRSSGNKEKARVLRSFFKTGAGQYGEGDVFLGIAVPEIRKIARRCQDISSYDIIQLLRSRIHEERMLALVLLLSRYGKATTNEKKIIYSLYLENIKHINSWDLVDVSAPHIVGDFLFKGNRSKLYCFARSKSLWERRTALVATFRFIRAEQFYDTIAIVKLLLKDEEDLIHKAAGWMLREVGKRNPRVHEQFLKTYYKKMPRTMLRYAIEKLPQYTRQAYLRAKV